MTRVALGIIAALLMEVAGAAVFPGRAAELPGRITLPPGLRLAVFASGLGSPRFMAWSAGGDLLVSVPRRGHVVGLRDGARSGRADRMWVVAEGLDLPHGLAFRDPRTLYVAETGRVVRYRYDPATGVASSPEVVVPNLPVGGSHFTRTIAFGPDGKLYVSIGSSCNACIERDPRRAAVVRYNADGSGERLFAQGLRNAVGITFDERGRLWGVVNGRDWLGDEFPPEILVQIKDGRHYGWPHCNGRRIPDPDLGRPGFCETVELPDFEMQAHSAPLGLTFYTGHTFPAEYRGDLFIGFHGSWNRSMKTGYKVVRVRMRDGRPTAIEDFATGWLVGDRVWGRPVDVSVGPDGALYVSDDSAGLIYRITYPPREAPAGR
jgi:glucose/arabinose dehydrogenase